MVGSIKDKTPNFNFIIPEFNIATWHDYVEQNFRSIDALLNNLFGINQYKGIWANVTTYAVNDVVFIGGDSRYLGSLFKVKIAHTTTDATFTSYYTANPTYYERFADASSAELFANVAKQYATKTDGTVLDENGQDTGEYSAKKYKNDCLTLLGETEAQALLATNASSAAATSATNALTSATLAGGYADSASTSATNANNAMTSAQALVSDFEDTVDTATTVFNTNATTKTTAFNTNATTKTNDFNTNATAKQALVDSAATSAQNSATSAQQYAQDAKGFAPIGSLLPLNCTADYIPDGCLPCDGSQYTKAQFTTLWTNYLTSSPVKLQTCTYAEYTTAISTYGFCDKFAVDTTALTFKVPTRPNKAYIGVNSTAPVKGNGMTLGLTGPDTYKAGLVYRSDTGSLTTKSNSYGANTGTIDGTATGNLNHYTMGITTDPTKSGIIADTSNLIKESTDIRWFVVVANAQINQSQMDWSAWATSLAGKANTDLSNVASNIDYVVERSSSSILPYWWEVWKSGKIRQGTSNSITTSGVITFLKPFTGTNYSFSCLTRTSNIATYIAELVANRTNTGTVVVGSATTTHQWIAEGY